jgi:hypothetical protein
MKVKVSHIGSIAQGLLTHAQAGSVMGASSRGAFLRLAFSWIVFLSAEAQRGPLTLNCARQATSLDELAIGEKAEITPVKIIFPTSGVVVDTSQAVLWQSPDLPSPLLSPGERTAKLRLVAELVHDRQPASLLAGLLPVVAGFAQQTPTPQHALIPQIEALQCALTEGQLTGIVASLAGFFGLGSGLTPSGDDLVLGFLLALRRWGAVLAPEIQVEVLNRQLLPMAYQQTTTLSANLLECASLGQADERLLLALDGIMTTHPDPPSCAAALAAWGNTSGHDALVGMALIVHTPH